MYFNPRAPYGARPAIPCSPPPGVLFQSTRPIRGATVTQGLQVAAVRISIHAPHTGRDIQGGQLLQGCVRISIHAPHTGRDVFYGRSAYQSWYFNPRAPYGARLVERLASAPDAQFQSTRPIRGATRAGVRHAQHGAISIHAPHTGRDMAQYDGHVVRNISIHAPHTGRDFDDPRHRFHTRQISIHAPHTGRDPGPISVAIAVDGISIHAPHTGRDDRSG